MIYVLDEIISFTSDILEEVMRVDIPEIHDRIIVATARYYRVGILTKDRIIFESEIKNEC